MENKEFVLPEEWYLKVDDNILGLLNKWRYDFFNKREPMEGLYNYISSRGWGCYPQHHVEITSDQFKQYVFNDEGVIPKKPENLDYLIDLFEKLKVDE